MRQKSKFSRFPVPGEPQGVLVGGGGGGWGGGGGCGGGSGGCFGFGGGGVGVVWLKQRNCWA